MELISVIVPVYKVEKYLHKCVESILNQKYTEIEIILVDDGSPDGCGAICDEYAKKDSRVKVIHKKNGGLSDARNAGLDISRGKYIAFIDSDDYVAPEFLDALYTALVSADADMSVAGILRVDERGVALQQYHEKPKLEEKVLSGTTYMNEMYTFVQVTHKLYKAEIWKDLRFPYAKLHEDEFVLHYVCERCKKISVIADELYFYLCRPDSIMTT